jgi:pimeloyl-ACP methyl ester carboxylesterase
MKSIYLLFNAFILLHISISGFSVPLSVYTETPITLQTKTGSLSGTLNLPASRGPIPVAIIIAGSGPTDRDGNQMNMKCDELKKLAAGLGENDIATVRYDKRGIGESTKPAKEEDIQFEDLVNDVRDWVRLLKNDKRFSKVIVIGHSEGALIGMLAAEKADAYISIASPGYPLDDILKVQLGQQPQEVKDMIFPMIDSLKKGYTIANVDPKLYALFRPSIQAYLISIFKYNPATEIKKLAIPIEIIQGTSDIQVSVSDAKLLAAAVPSARLLLIDNMNHVFREVKSREQKDQMSSYTDPSIPIMQSLVEGVRDFISK